MPKMDPGSRLKELRQAAGLTLRELGELIGERHSTISYWENSGKFPRSDVLVSLAKALGVSVEELLGEVAPSKRSAPNGRARQLFEAVSKLSRRQQDKIVDVVEAYVAQQSSK